jgi:hypothetical protein
MAYPFKNNPTQKKINPIQIKKNPSKLKLTHPTQIKLTQKLNSKEISLLIMGFTEPAKETTLMEGSLIATNSGLVKRRCK